MALTAAKGFAHVTLVDYQGDKSTLRLDLVDTALADVATAIASYMTAIDHLAAITDAKIVSVYIGTEYTDTGYGSPGSNVEENAVISAKLATAGKFGVLRIPAPKSGVFLSGPGKDANTVDIADSDLKTWLADFYASTPNLFKTSDGETIADPATAGNFKGRRVFRHSRKRAPR